MTALDAFLYGMPLALVAGAGVVLWFARRAAIDVASRSEPRSQVHVGSVTSITSFRALRDTDTAA